ncbi:EF-P lysine aminoacylase GenX [Candidatus Uhrbacteria bacterium RIFCSPHIGHO2_12_FULL_60_25]|uniref:EF-P lysine aminoacylase GenX n=1 Tax=Candidatus Uhrbacteria bacterium RIFCSPHIGHO2_12_FULL_60_25 TaxID=1802399 RepID=A0A1F7UJ40_9BACT|nr:MAG: EF-P lysine aminoacylase GenX [Candidatus Uhrbacteria bacterium RIFCSPHIGHO2_02_FULL_60_44]OGL78279.1 MAG: EF-P lysine aminoacylase GenX [Candidatus Uhrbacteria bacterium RIFCSPHIGHO2_12_FULL_60_25]
MNVQNLRQRSATIKLIRRFFDERGYVEMHTPRLVGSPGQEPHLEPFWSEVVESNGTRHAAALITSPEYAMKRLLAAGFDKIYDLGPCFRNGEPFDGSHDPEFLMLEWYRKGGDLKSLMDETEEMVRWVAIKYREPGTGNREQLKYPVPRSPFPVPEQPFRRMTCEEAWKEYAGADLASLIGDREAMSKVAREHGQTVADGDSWDDLYFKVFLSKIEPKVAEAPTFLYRYPASQAALARACADDPRFAERVELYAGGLELANGFVELADADEQRHRFVEEQELRRSLGKKMWAVDERFLSDLPGMGEAVGIAFGVDRFVMLLTGTSSINDVVPFPARERFGT